MKRLALFLDGTWNKPDDNTSVWRLYMLTDVVAASGVEQRLYYDTGVGTKRFDRLRGGAFGTGLTDKVRQAYEWLVRNYDDGDEIFIFGFSRGAYTARSLAGIISRCGILLPGASTNVAEIFDRYRSQKRGIAPEAQAAAISFIGVWDTVGALGIPGLSRKRYHFLNPNPSVSYQAMYHALAVDENRRHYRATLWTKWAPKDEDPEPLKPGQILEQRWFAGAHSNVGGGYSNDALPAVPLSWMQRRANSHGLTFRRTLEPAPDAHLAPVTDSYGRFLLRLYRLPFRRYWRPIGERPTTAKVRKTGTAGNSHQLNQVIDATVFDRYRRIDTYRPRNLKYWAAASNQDPANIHKDTSVGSWLHESVQK